MSIPPFFPLWFPRPFSFIRDSGASFDPSRTPQVFSHVASLIGKPRLTRSRTEKSSAYVRDRRTLCSDSSRFFVCFAVTPFLFAASPPQARAAIALYFRNNGHLKDPRVVDALVMKGYMDLEETTMQVRSCILDPAAQRRACLVI